MSAPTDLPSGMVTFLFTDVVGSARLVQVLGEGYRPMLAEYRRLLRSVLPHYGGVEMSVAGDSCRFVFSDALAALRGCVSAQKPLSGSNWPAGLARPKVRMGVHTGLVEPIDGEYMSIEVIRAARVTEAAHGGQVLCSANTAGSVTLAARQAFLLDLGLYQLRDFTEELRLFQVAAPGLPRTFPVPRADRHAQRSPDASDIVLTRTESKVAGLVAEGLSNPQIAQRLYISRHTVETHMKHIFAKLAVTSRAELASVITRHLLVPTK